MVSYEILQLCQLYQTINQISYISLENLRKCYEILMNFPIVQTNFLGNRQMSFSLIHPAVADIATNLLTQTIS